MLPKLGWQLPCPLLEKMQERYLQVILDNVFTCGMVLILLEDAVLPLEQISLSGFTTGSRTVSSGILVVFYSWHVEMNYSSFPPPIPWHSPLHRHRKWVVTFLNSRKFCFGLVWCPSINLVILIEFLCYGKNFLIRKLDFFKLIFTVNSQQVFWSFEL